ncbi:hypothetical protein QJS10_CPB14g00005 [Acorus calamus]|uniref:Late embryogenesis abundant protein D-29 n=1 Tax=Acorus calamus TaxID=4465 RepID=A0AAV9DCU2_ACOCL|nr:hypothetical protein QJS10_CPB14g00005 [Acorus calamus]
MGKGKQTLLLVSLLMMMLLSSSVLVSSFSMEEAGVEANRFAADAKDKTTEAAKEASESWADWAKDKFTDNNAFDQWCELNGRGMGFRHDNSREAANQMEDKAGDAASLAKQKFSDAVYGSADALGARGMTDEGKNAAENGYKDAINGATHAYETARDTMTNQAKSAYESAKEKASEAAANLGARIN